MTRLNCIFHCSLPEDIALQIASLLQFRDLCALGSCSRFWRQLCGSDCIWESLVRRRWPSLPSYVTKSSSSLAAPAEAPVVQEWRGFYVKRHKEAAAKATVFCSFVEDRSRGESLEAGDFLQAVELLLEAQFGFKDVQIFLFQPKLNVLHNIIALQYCIKWLQITAKDVIGALHVCKISDRLVCVRWWKIGGCLYGFRLRDESIRCSLPLADIAREERILGVLHRGAIHEVQRIRISVVDRPPAWPIQMTVAVRRYTLCGREEMNE